MAHLDQRWAVSLHATPHSATTDHPYVFTETDDLRSLLSPDQTEAFVREVLPHTTVRIQTKPQGDEEQYRWEVVQRGDYTDRRAHYRMRLLGGRLVDGAMQRQFSLPGGGWPDCATVEEINRINLARGAVFYSLNTLRDGARRCDANVTRIDFVAVDLDKVRPPAYWPLTPTCVIETSPGKFHVLWRVHGVALSDFKRIQQGLARSFGGDPAVSNPSCQLRLPGTINNKGSRPVQVKLLVCNRTGYSIGEFYEAFPNLKPTAEAPRDTRVIVPETVGSDRRTRYGIKALQDETNKVLGSADSGRHKQLYRSAAALGNLVGGGVIAEGTVVAALLEAATTVGVTEREALRTIENGVRNGKATPRGFGGAQ